MIEETDSPTREDESSTREGESSAREGDSSARQGESSTREGESSTREEIRRRGISLRGYALLIGTYASATVGTLVAAQRQGRLPESVETRDIVIIAVATQRLSRLITKDRVASVLRVPFTTYQGDGGPAEVEEAARGTGVRRAVGELLVCPFCLAQWIATAFMCGLIFAPRVTRVLSAVFSAVAGADLLQLAYNGAQRVTTS